MVLSTLGVFDLLPACTASPIFDERGGPWLRGFSYQMFEAGMGPGMDICGAGESLIIFILSSSGSWPNTSRSVFAVMVACGALGGALKVCIWREDGVTDSIEMTVFFPVGMTETPF